MIRVAALTTAAALLMAGCFVFDNPLDGGSAQLVTFPIVITSALYGGTYTWNEVDYAYEATVGASRYYVYLDSLGRWCLGSILDQPYNSAICFVASPPFAAQPITTGTYWTPMDKLTGIDVSAGGISAQGYSPDTPISQAQVLQVAFQASLPATTVACQWVSSNTETGTTQTVLGTGSTFALTGSNKFTWIRVILTPMDSDGNVVGSAVTSPPVYVSS